MVTRTKEGGVGDRVCVDLIQSLAEGEGVLVGSSAKMLALVHAETFETGFVPARRVHGALRFVAYDVRVIPPLDANYYRH